MAIYWEIESIATVMISHVYPSSTLWVGPPDKILKFADGWIIEL